MDRFYATVANQGVFESDNDGSSWTEIDSGIPQMKQADGLKVVATYDTFTDQTNLFVVTEQGGFVTGHGSRIQWVATARAISRIGPRSGACRNQRQAMPTLRPQADIDEGHFALLADPNAGHPNVIYFASYQNNIYRINAGDGSWTLLLGGTLGSPHADQRGLAFLGNTTLLDVDDGGMYALSDPLNPPPGDHWVGASGNIADTELLSIAYDSINGAIFGGCAGCCNPRCLPIR